MATTVKMQISARDSAMNNISTTIGYVNPNVPDGIIVEFAKKLNALTSNTFKSVSKIETTDITDLDEYDLYISQVNKNGIYTVDANQNSNIAFPVSGSFDGELYPVCKNISNTNYATVSEVQYDTDSKVFNVHYTAGANGGIDTFELRVQKTQDSDSDADLAAPKFIFYIVVNA